MLTMQPTCHSFNFYGIDQDATSNNTSQPGNSSCIMNQSQPIIPENSQDAYLPCSANTSYILTDPSYSLPDQLIDNSFMVPANNGSGELERYLHENTLNSDNPLSKEDHMPPHLPHNMSADLLSESLLVDSTRRPRANSCTNLSDCSSSYRESDILFLGAATPTHLNSQARPHLNIEDTMINTPHLLEEEGFALNPALSNSKNNLRIGAPPPPPYFCQPTLMSMPPSTHLVQPSNFRENWQGNISGTGYMELRNPYTVGYSPHKLPPSQHTGFDPYLEYGTNVHFDTRADTSNLDPLYISSIFAEGSSRKPTKRVHICQFCRRTFTRRHDLHRHIRIHTGDKPYKCNFCYRGFSRTDALKRHYRVDESCKQAFDASEEKED